MNRYLYWSGGKDSTASLIICYEHGIHLDGVVMSEVMFDIKRNISGEDPQHIEWIHNVAIPIIEKMGYKVIILRAKQDFLSIFHKRIGKRSKYPHRIGKKVGWVIGGMCTANDRLKMKPIKEFKKQVGEHEQIVGIAHDEPSRLKGLFDKKNKRSVLNEFNISEAQTYDICRKYNLLSPVYSYSRRGGCWFCPNQSIQSFARLKRLQPHLWNELKTLSQDKEIVSQGFKYGLTFAQVERQVNLINNQISIFDLGVNYERISN